jgi:membrane-associated phospholipid phosphatase
MQSLRLSLYISLIALLAFTGCNKMLELPDFAPIQPVQTDRQGGNWQPLVLTRVTDISVPAPMPIGSSSYQSEVQELISLQSNLTDEQRAKIRYWGAGAVFRWNEIARELAARYNLPPAPTADGRYPVPDANNPSADPKFPFANPPYAARVFAYLGAAQYDALISAWHYKFLYKRQAAHLNDNRVQALLPVSEIPSYPSEEATVAAVSLEVLKVLFPNEVISLEQTAADHWESSLRSGRYTKSDVDAGKLLGRSVAEQILRRMRADGIGQSNNQALVSNMITNAKGIGINPVWVSQEIPARPPLLPGFGFLQPWHFTMAQTSELRPVPPPAPNSEETRRALDELRSYSKNLTREQHRIASYWSDGPGSYTPPGHWNRRAGELVHRYQLNELRAARVFAFTGTALMDAAISCWDIKYHYYYPRPQQLDPAIKTPIGLPNFPAYTSGHSTFSGAAAEVLSFFFPQDASTLQQWAKEASESRIYGCIHFRFDCEVGLASGQQIGGLATTRARKDNAE